MKASISRSVLGVTAVLGITMSMAVSAAGGTPASSAAPFPAFHEIDKNHNGVVTRSELPDHLSDLRAHFDQYDGGDHRLTQAEYANYLSAARQIGRCESFTSSTCVTSLSSAGQMSVGWSAQYSSKGLP